MLMAGFTTRLTHPTSPYRGAGSEGTRGQVEHPTNVVRGRVSASVPQELAEKLRNARNAAQPVEKKGCADEGFDFVRAVDLIEEARRLLKGRGIVVIPSVESIEQKMGKSGVLVHAHLTFEIVLVKTGDSIVKSWVGSGFDYPGDKAVYKAITGGTKYFYANLLGIPFGVDPEEGQGKALADPEVERLRTQQDEDATRPDLQAVSGA